MGIKLNKSEQYSKSNNLSETNNNSYSFYEYIDITLGDPISSILLNDKYVIIGTMMGKIKILSLISENEKIILINLRKPLENISGLSFSDDYSKLYASIGDLEIIIQKIKEPLTKDLPPYLTLDLYETNYQHSINCENSYILMSHYNLLKINIFSPENEERIKDDVYINFEIIYFNKNDYSNKNIKGHIKSTNFYVPLDFDGNYFCWVEYINDKMDRNLCIHNITKNDNIQEVDYKFQIDKNFGHISHAKIINKNKIFIVRDLNKCEIRNISSDFELLESFTHIGDEVYAVDIFIHESNTLYNEDKNNNHIKDFNKNISKSLVSNNEYIYKKSNDKKVNESQKIHAINAIKNHKKKKNNLFESNSIELKTDSLNLLKNKSKKIKNIENNQNICIITLDIDGNVNKYENKVEEKLFNLYDIKNIEQDHKDKKFFYMGYIYYIKTNLNYFCITTDFGCYIIKKNE